MQSEDEQTDKAAEIRAEELPVSPLGTLVVNLKGVGVEKLTQAERDELGAQIYAAYCHGHKVGFEAGWCDGWNYARECAIANIQSAQIARAH